MCAYCWNYFRNLHPEKAGKFYSANEVAKRILAISEKKACNKIRISGAEPILGERSFKHLTDVIAVLRDRLTRFQFISETNGFILGYYPELIRELRRFEDFLLVRISIKGWDEESFEKISGAKGHYFKFPLIGLRHLIENNINAWPAVMYEIFKGEGIEVFNRAIRNIGLSPDEVEFESMELYPIVKENLAKRGIIGSLHKWNLRLEYLYFPRVECIKIKPFQVIPICVHQEQLVCRKLWGLYGYTAT